MPEYLSGNIIGNRWLNAVVFYTLTKMDVFNYVVAIFCSEKE